MFESAGPKQQQKMSKSKERTRTRTNMHKPHDMALHDYHIQHFVHHALNLSTPIGPIAYKGPLSRWHSIHRIVQICTNDHKVDTTFASHWNNPAM